MMSKKKQKKKEKKVIIHVVEKKCDCGWCHPCLIAFRKKKEVEESWWNDTRCS